MLKQGGLSSRQENGRLLLSINFTAKCDKVFVSTQENSSL